MACGIELQDAPAEVYKSAVQDHFAFRMTYDDGGKKVVDKRTTVCKHCACVLFMSIATRQTSPLIYGGITPG